MLTIHIPLFVEYGTLIWKLALATLVASSFVLARRHDPFRRSLAVAAVSFAAWYGAMWTVGKLAGTSELALAMPGSRPAAFAAWMDREATNLAFEHVSAARWPAATR